MPFKTRREKIAAAQRRYTFEPGKEQRLSGFIPSSPVAKSSEINSPDVPMGANNNSSGDAQILKDLLKILLLAASIMLAQFVLSFADQFMAI